MVRHLLKVVKRAQGLVRVFAEMLMVIGGKSASVLEPEVESLLGNTDLFRVVLDDRLPDSDQSSTTEVFIRRQASVSLHQVMEVSQAEARATGDRLNVDVRFHFIIQELYRIAESTLVTNPFLPF